jgi:glutamate N-acetyltransferase / amino-acid N-acetyltransferase
VTTLPAGFRSHVANIGVKDDTDDFVVIAAERAVPVAAVFTRSLFAGPSVGLSRSTVADGSAQAVVVISKNANVATGQQGHDDAVEVARSVAGRLRCEPTDVVLTSTGVIGRRYPMDRIRAGIAALPEVLTSDDAAGPARGMMTTDTVAKLSEAAVAGSTARVVGMAKGVGMIEPDMATHISLLFTDAELSGADLDAVFRRVVDRTFNCVSIDTDTSTSDSSVIMASGAAGPVQLDAFETALEAVALDLTKQIARDGEGAHSLIEVHVDAARDVAQAKRVAKAIVNSPLVKTAVHGGDPNWGRVAIRGHADAAVDPDGLGVHVAVGDALDSTIERELARGRRRRGAWGTARPSALGEQVLLERLAGLALAVDRGVDQARGDGVDPDADGREVAGDRQGHADHAALGGRVAGLADLAVERGHRRDVDDGAALAVLERLGGAHRGGGEADAVERADQVDGDDLLERVEVGGRLVAAVLADGALRPADAGGVDEHRSGPIDLAISTALTMSSVLVTSTLQKAPPISSASSLPLSSCRSAMTTLAPWRPACGPRRLRFPRLHR